MSKRAYTRKHVRFKPDPLDIAYIQFESTGTKSFPKEFKADCVAYIEELAPLGGCGVVLHDCDGLQSGATIRIQLGPLAPLLGKIVFKRSITESLVRVGCQFLE